jgi:homoserine kinase
MKRPTRSRVKVVVPASTSNLGPAFDCLGLALGLYNELEVELLEGRGEPVVEIQGEGAQTLPRTGENLIVRAFNGALAGRVEGRFLFRCVNRIPLARGLGSSAASAVAGLFAANAFLADGGALTSDQLLDYAIALEGHPDNVAPAIMGGLVASARRQKASVSWPLKPHKDLKAAVCIPDFELSTKTSRGVLPDTYLRADAIDNVARAVLLGTALERGLWDRLPLAMEDRFHQPYRAKLVKGLSAVIRAAQEAGCGGALSGAGPAVLALGAPENLEAAGAAMVKAFAAHGVTSRSVVLPVDRKGVRVSQ